MGEIQCGGSIPAVPGRIEARYQWSGHFGNQCVHRVRSVRTTCASWAWKSNGQPHRIKRISNHLSHHDPRREWITTVAAPNAIQSGVILSANKEHVGKANMRRPPANSAEQVDRTRLGVVNKVITRRLKALQPVDKLSKFLTRGIHTEPSECSYHPTGVHLMQVGRSRVSNHSISAIRADSMDMSEERGKTEPLISLQIRSTSGEGV